MLRRMTDMPAGTIGFEAIGEVEDDDWERAVEPVLRDEMAGGRKIRLLYLLGPEAREVEGDAMTGRHRLSRAPRVVIRAGRRGQRRGLDAPGAARTVVPAARKGQGFPRT